MILSDNEDESEDPALTALLHERVVRVKREINWDEEELKLREKRREREIERNTSSDESDSECSVAARWRRKRRGNLARTVASASRLGKVPSHSSAPPTTSRGYLDFRNTDTSLQVGTALESLGNEGTSQEDTTVYTQENSDGRQELSMSLCSRGACFHSDDAMTSDCSNLLSRQPLCQPELLSTLAYKALLKDRGTTGPESTVRQQPSHEPGQLFTSVHKATSELPGSSKNLYSDVVHVPLENSETLSEQLVCQVCTSVHQNKGIPSGDVASASEGSEPLARQQPCPPEQLPASLYDIAVESLDSEGLLSDVVSAPETSAPSSSRLPYRQQQGPHKLSTSMFELRHNNNDSEVESDIESEPSPTRHSQSKFEDKSEPLLSGYESGYVDEKNCNIPVNTDTARLHVTEELQVSVNNHTKISTSTPKSIKMKSLQLSLKRAPVPTPPRLPTPAGVPMSEAPGAAAAKLTTYDPPASARAETMQQDGVNPHPPHGHVITDNVMQPALSPRYTQLIKANPQQGSCPQQFIGGVCNHVHPPMSSSSPSCSCPSSSHDHYHGCLRVMSLQPSVPGPYTAHAHATPQGGSHAHLMPSCPDHILNAPTPCSCVGHSSQLTYQCYPPFKTDHNTFYLPYMQPMLSFQQPKRSREEEQVCGEGYIASQPPAKKHCHQ